MKIHRILHIYNGSVHHYTIGDETFDVTNIYRNNDIKGYFVLYADRKLSKSEMELSIGINR